jgi:purine-binding chemotaxis protein CheW
VGTEQYAIPLLKIKEVIPFGDLTRIPHAPAFLSGLINLHGRIISIIDLQYKMHFKTTKITPETTIIVLNLSSICIGFMASQVEAVIATSVENIQDFPQSHQEEHDLKKNGIIGFIHQKNNSILILDVETIFSIEEIKKIRIGSNSVI